MASRYDFTNISKTETNKRKLETTIYPKIEKQLTDIYIISRPGDRLDLLAQDYYSDPSLWWIIAQANQLGKGSFAIPTGRQIRIPTIADDVRLLLQQTSIER